MPKHLASLGAGGPGFTPTQLSGLALWLKADSLGLSDGTAVSSWTDSSGNGRNAGQATGTKQPLCKTGIVNGLPVVRFDATDCLTTSAIDFTGTSGLTVFAVTANIPSGTDRVIVESSASFSANAGSFILYRDTSNKVQVDHRGNVGNGFCVGTTNITSTATVLTGWYDFTQAVNAENQLYVNGTAEGTKSGGANNTGAFGNHVLNIGARNDGALIPLNGDIAEIILYNSVLSNASRQLVERYLGAKYGITVA